MYASNRRVSLLHQATGVTDVNIGLDTLMSTLLAPFRTAQTRLQTTGQPIQHRVARIVRKLLRFYQTILTTVEFSEPYATWRNLMFIPATNKRALVAKIDEVGFAFVRKLVGSLEDRLRPYIPFYEAWEMIDPTGPSREVIHFD